MVDGIPAAKFRKTPADPFSGAGFSFEALRAEFGDAVQRMPDGPHTDHDGGQVSWLGGTVHGGKAAAIRRPDGTKEWIVKGQRHRDEGPAIINADGTEEWWQRGKKLTAEEADELKKKIVEKILTVTRDDVAAPARAMFKKLG